MVELEISEEEEQLGLLTYETVRPVLTDGLL